MCGNYSIDDVRRIRGRLVHERIYLTPRSTPQSFGKQPCLETVPFQKEDTTLKGNNIFTSP